MHTKAKSLCNTSVVTSGLFATWNVTQHLNSLPKEKALPGGGFCMSHH